MPTLFESADLPQEVLDDLKGIANAWKIGFEAGYKAGVRGEDTERYARMFRSGPIKPYPTNVDYSTAREMVARYRAATPALDNIRNDLADALQFSIAAVTTAFKKEQPVKNIKARFYEKHNVGGGVGIACWNSTWALTSVAVPKGADFIRWIGEEFEINTVRGQIVVDSLDRMVFDPHLKIKADWAAIPETEKGWWVRQYTEPGAGCWHNIAAWDNEWSTPLGYRIMKSAAHPDNLSKKTLVSMAAMPPGTVTTVGTIVETPCTWTDGGVSVIAEGAHRVQVWRPEDVHLLPDQPWLDNPNDNTFFPAGCIVEQGDGKIRFVKLAEGFTFDPKEAAPSSTDGCSGKPLF